MVWCASMNTLYKLPHDVAVADAVKLVRQTPATFIAFQELFSPTRRRMLGRSLDDIGWRLYTAGPIGIAWREKTWTPQRRGAYLLHRSMWRGTRGAGGGWQGTRHVVWVQLRNGNRVRTCAGIHHVPSPDASKARDRVSELEIGKTVRWMGSAHMPIVLGDWNAPWTHQNLDRLYDAGFTTSFQQKRVKRPTHGTKQIDYAAYDPDDYYCKTNEVLEGYRSDHRPVLCDIYPKRR